MAEDLISQIESINQSSFKDDANTRLRLLAAAQALCIRLETPFDFVQRITWQEPSFLMCLKIADDIGLYKQLGAEGSPPKSVEELATATSVEPKLLSRIARQLAARHVLQISEPTTQATTAAADSFKPSLGFYAATHISTALATPEGSSGIKQTCNMYYPNFLAMPDLLRERGYTTPTDNRDGPFQRRVGMKGSTYFELLQRSEHKALAENFNLLMKFTTQERRSFLDVCDVGEMLRTRPYAAKKDGGNDGYLFVDIGGGTGTDVLAFRKRFSDMAGKVELQDLPRVIEAASTALAKPGATFDGGKIVLRAHDFFKEQPVCGSRIFFMGSILHDWPDTDALRILRNIASAMRPDYSTLLLSENVLSGTECHPHLSAVDLTMMTSLASSERSENDWTGLLSSAGLKIVKIHTVPSSLKSVIECELA